MARMGDNQCYFKKVNGNVYKASIKNYFQYPTEVSVILMT